MTLPLAPRARNVARIAPPLCREAQEILANVARLKTGELAELLEACESPAEEMFLAALCSRWEGHVSADHRQVFAHLASNPEWAGLFRVVLEPQKLIRTAGGSYRADVFLFVTRVRLDPEPEQWGPIVVEIDGHEWHERTKEQAASDRKRDRDLVKEGIRVVRFTGSEVFNRPFECAQEVDELLCQTARETLEAFREAGRLDELVGGGGDDA